MRLVGRQGWWSRVGGIRSLQIRLALVSIVAVGVTLLLAQSVLISLFERQARQQFEDSLRIQLDQLTANVELTGEGSVLSVRDPSSDPRWGRPYSGLYWQVSVGLDNRGQADTDTGVLQRSRSLWDARLSLPGDTLSSAEVHLHPISGPSGQSLIAAERSVVFDTDDSPTPVRLVIAADIVSLSTAVTSFSRSLTQYLFALGLVMSFLVAAQVVYGLAPLRTLDAALARLRGGKADLLDGQFPSEVSPLVDQFNAVLTEQRRNIQRARSLAGNLAHAIKTPLSVIANAADDAALEGRELRETVRHYSALAEKQVVWHLKRARMAASATSQYAPVWIPQIFAGIFTVLGRAYQQRCIAVSIDIPDCLRFLGEREDLEEVLGNLLDNAFKWARSSVTVSFRAIDMRPTLVIDDDGPGVAQERYTDILKRGMRLDEVVPGSGLGLAIVVELVTLYNGNLGFSRSPQGGLRVELQLPMQLG